ncbi:MAG: type I restriction enzyme HsdR N-terminal domain-containing protein [Thermoanaerobacteraceae bacterium]|nr:type I restriction enzyme HsdR N-terminal domain-containing protein [Thermoanaerobacteraceae bacterium]
MNIETQLKSVSFPKIFRSNGEKCYFDLYRKRLIRVTPKETVRQRIASFFEKHLGFPRDMILLDVPINYYVENCKGRADIIIHEINDDNTLKPLAIIECKANSLALTDNVFERVIRYADEIGADYVMVTNGIEIEIAKYNEISDSYDLVNSLLTYREMVNGVYLPKNEENIAPRLNYNELRNLKLIDDFNQNNESRVFGVDTLPALKPHIVNLYQCLMDTSHSLPPLVRSMFALIEDIGIRYMEYGNAGGGFYCGNYRSFLIKDEKDDTQIISISLFGTDPNFRGENRHGYTSIVVAIDQYKRSHTCLQYNIDMYAILEGSYLSFFHNGRISRRSSKDLLSFIRDTESNLAISESGEINLGKIPIDKLLYLDDNDVSNFIYNLIEYAILRDKFYYSCKK